MAKRSWGVPRWAVNKQLRRKAVDSQYEHEPLLLPEDFFYVKPQERHYEELCQMPAHQNQ